MTDHVSIGRLQQELNISYKDATNVMVILEERGMITPANRNGQREICIKDS